MEINNGMRKVASAVGLLLSLISAIFTIKLLTTFATNGSEKILYGGFGACVQTAQTLLYLYGVFCIWKGEPGKAIPGIVMFLFLFGLSLVGTIGFFATTNSDQSQQAKHSNINYAAMVNRLQQIDNQMGIEQKHLSECPPKWNKNCIQPRERAIEALQAERADLGQRIEGFKAVPQTDALYMMIAEFFQGGNPSYEDVQQVKFFMFVLYSLALDLTSVVLLAYSAGLLNFIGGTNNSPNPDPRGKKPIPRDNNTDTRIDRIEALIMQLAANQQQQPVTNHANPSQGMVDNQVANHANPNNSLQDKGFNGMVDNHANPSQGPVDNQVTNHANSDINQATLWNYINALYPKPPKPDKSLNGKNRVVSTLGITNWEADNIHNFLKANNLVRVIGTKTFPCMEKHELLAMIGLETGNTGNVINMMGRM
ncbi:MAG: hypothetical protein GY749_48175 [Desulfobacteraceae bacterium]|nr:hypothetical protein [Desulfobacteraceae bacterium]